MAFSGVELGRIFAVSNWITLTLTLSPRRGNSQFPLREEALNGESLPRLAGFTLSRGRGRDPFALNRAG